MTAKSWSKKLPEVKKNDISVITIVGLYQKLWDYFKN